MELKQIKELMSMMERLGVKKLSIKEKSGFELQLERHDEAPAHPQPVHYHPHPAVHHTLPSHPAGVPVIKEVEQGRFPSGVKGEEPGAKEAAGKFITSPMVGTFYASPSPDDPHFVKVGDRVEENTVVCIIEAMKVMNEVKAGISGTVAEIFVDNAHPVEFGTKMYRIV